MDTLSPAERSARMALVRGRKNKSTELKLASLLRSAGIIGWRRHLPLPGTPDFAFPKKKLAIFVDGDFWHGNPENLRIPKSRVDFWTQKITRNRERDIAVTMALRERGWEVIRFWESYLKKSPHDCLRQIAEALQSDFGKGQ